MVYVSVQRCTWTSDIHELMQATAEAITLGDCLSAEAISDVLSEVGGDFDAFSTCGGEATVMEADPEVAAEEVRKAEALRARK